MAYLIATSFQHCMEYLPDVDLNKLPHATVFAVLQDGNYLLANVNPPEQVVECYVHSRGDVVQAKVQQIYEIIQTGAIAWCEL